MTALDSTPTWSHGARNLHDFICKARLSASENVTPLLLQHLNDYKPRFRALLDDAPKNAEHRRALQAGDAYIDGAQYKVNDEFIQNAILLSDELDINEYEASTLLHFGIEEATRVDSDLIHASIELYHVERGYLLASLEVILKSIADSSIEGPVKQHLLQFVQDIMDDKAIPSGDKGAPGTYPSKILQTTKKLNGMIKTLTKNGTLTTAPNTTQTGSQPPPTSQPTASATPTTSLLGAKPAAPTPLFGAKPAAPTTTLFGAKPAAPSTTIAPTSTTVAPTPRIEGKITAMRIEKLTDERIYLMQLLYHLASLFWLDGDDLLTIIGHVEKSNLSTLTTPYLSMILMAALSPRSGLKDGNDLALDSTLIKKCHDKIQQGQWKVPALQSMVTLQWVAFMMDTIQRNASVEPSLPLNDQQCMELASKAVSSSRVFGFMNDYLLGFQREGSDTGESKNYVTEDNVLVLDGLTVDPGDYTKFIADIKLDFQDFVVYEIKALTTFIIVHMTDVLRDLNYKEEDRVSQTAPVVTKKSAIVGPADELSKKQDPELLFTLLANLYRTGRNDGLWFWTLNDSTDDGFVKWVVENVKLVGTMRACFEFFGAISTGDECARRSFKFFELGTVRPDIGSSSLFSWGKLFAAIHFYVPLLRQATEQCPAAFPPGEEDLLKTFLYLLKQVVQYSGEARLALWNDPAYRVRDSLTELANSAISASLRASLCDVLAAFCSPWGGGINGVGRNISLQVWHIVENGNVFIVKSPKQQQHNTMQSSRSSTPSQAPASTADQLAGFLTELSLERESRSYTETLSILNLLVNLIHIQTKRDELQSGFSPAVLSVPSDLGKETRFPGAQPYIAMVIDNVLMTLDDQRYKNLNEKWQLTEMCLKILENSVYSFDITQLLDAHVAWKQSPTYRTEMDKALCYYITHPGFDIIIRILSGSFLVSELFSIVSKAAEQVIKSKESTLCKSIPGSLVRCLRIIYRVLQLQDSFGNVLLPDVVRSSIRLPSGKYRIADLTFSSWPSLAPVGNHMLCNKSTIIQMGKLIDFGDHEEVCHLSIKILHELSKEPSTSSDQYDPSRVSGISDVYGGLGSQLAELLAMDATSYDIIRGISERFEIEQPEQTTCDDYDYDTNNIPFWLASGILNNTYKFESDFNQQYMATSVRLSLLDMLLDNSGQDKPSPCMAEFLLGIEALTPTRNNNSNNQYSEHQSRNAKLICLHSILNMLRANLDVSSSTLDGELNDQDSDDTFLPLTATHPVLAEKCYQLIYRLCARSSISSLVMQYLRIRDDYFYNQLKAMLSTLSVYTMGNNVNHAVTPGWMVYPDGSQVPCDMIGLRSELHQRAWRLKTLAIELHMLSTTNAKSDTTRLLDLLYGGEEALEKGMNSSGADGRNSDTFLMQRHTVTEEPFTSFMELPTTLGFTWRDDLTKDDNNDESAMELPKLNYFSHFDAKQHQTKSVSGCKVNDIRNIYAYLRRQQRNMQQSGTLMMETDNWAAEKEMGDILRFLVADNHAREIQYGQRHCFEAWLQLIQVTVLDNFDMLPRAKRGKIIAILILKLLPMFTQSALNGNGNDDDFLLSLARTLLTFMGRLHQDSKSTTNALSAESSLSLHQQLHGIFERMAKIVQDTKMTNEVRQSMYATMILLVRTLPTDTDAAKELRQAMVKELARVRTCIADILDQSTTTTKQASSPSTSLPSSLPPASLASTRGTSFGK